MIAGLEDISDGELRIGGEVVNDKAPRDRDIAMVFQSYALYPHMSVRENMAFPLTIVKTPKDEVDRRVEEAADLLDLRQHLDRKPSQLSGGQRQRVAMGRAIVRDPKAFLMDEPLSNLDAKLRVQMRTSVARLQDQLGTTMVYVTHDQTEAMTLGDRVAIMRGGMLQQVGSPMELYNEPNNLFVAGFIGSPSMNFLPATRARATRSSCRWSTSSCPSRAAQQLGRIDAGKPLIAGIRPEDFEDAGVVGDGAGTARRSRPRSTCSRRWARSSTPTSRSTREGASWRSRTSCASCRRTPGGERPGRRGVRRRGPARPDERREAPRGDPRCGSTPRRSSSSTRRAARTSRPPEPARRGRPSAAPRVSWMA